MKLMTQKAKQNAKDNSILYAFNYLWQNHTSNHSIKYRIQFNYNRVFLATGRLIPFYRKKPVIVWSGLYYQLNMITLWSNHERKTHEKVL